MINNLWFLSLLIGITKASIALNSDVLVFSSNRTFLQSSFNCCFLEFYWLNFSIFRLLFSKKYSLIVELWEMLQILFSLVIQIIFQLIPTVLCICIPLITPEWCLYQCRPPELDIVHEGKVSYDRCRWITSKGLLMGNVCDPNLFTKHNRNVIDVHCCWWLFQWWYRKLRMKLRTWNLSYLSSSYLIILFYLFYFLNIN